MYQLQKIKKYQSGFTLIEIAIVMVIIGLLLGGVLKGQEMITNARIKNVVNDFEGIAAAVFSYQDRYKALPGDDPNAVTRWGAGTAITTTGTIGDGVLSGAYTLAANTDETGNFWDHLHLSGLISGTGLTHPTVAFGGLVGVEDDAFSIGGLTVCMNGIEAQHAAIIDTQLDDGVSTTGDVRGAILDTTTAVVYNVAAAPTAAFIICRSL